jgi:hypothetical protein
VEDPDGNLLSCSSPPVDKQQLRYRVLAWLPRRLRVRTEKDSSVGWTLVQHRAVAAKTASGRRDASDHPRNGTGLRVRLMPQPPGDGHSRMWGARGQIPRDQAEKSSMTRARSRLGKSGRAGLTVARGMSISSPPVRLSREGEEALTCRMRQQTPAAEIQAARGVAPFYRRELP